MLSSVVSIRTNRVRAFAPGTQNTGPLGKRRELSARSWPYLQSESATNRLRRGEMTYSGLVCACPDVPALTCGVAHIAEERGRNDYADGQTRDFVGGKQNELLFPGAVVLESPALVG